VKPADTAPECNQLRLSILTEGIMPAVDHSRDEIDKIAMEEEVRLDAITVVEGITS